MLKSLKLAVFTAIFVVLFLILSYGLTPVDFGSASIRQIRNERNEVLFIGNSHTFCTYNPILIQERLDIKVGMAAYSSQTFFTSSKLVMEALDMPKTKIIFLDVYLINKLFDKNKKVTSMYLDTLNPLKAFLYIKDYNHIVDKENRLPYSDALRITVNKKNFSKLFSNNFNTKGKYLEMEFTKNNISTKGYYPYNNKHTAKAYEKEVPKDSYSKNLIDRKSFTKINGISEKILLELIKKSKEKGIKLVLVDAPYYNAKISTIRARKNHIRQIAIENQIEFIDFNEKYTELELRWEDFKDSGHTNMYGAEKVTNFVVNWLKNRLDRN